MSPTGGVFIGLGANLGDREATLDLALERLHAEPNIDVLRCSKFHRTDAWGAIDQPEFLNAVAELSTALGPAELIERLLAVERELGRDRACATRWAARTIDLDLLLHGDAIVNEPGCHVPHPHLHERAFALRPLLEIAPDAVIPGRGAAGHCLARLDAEPAPLTNVVRAIAETVS